MGEGSRREGAPDQVPKFYHAVLMLTFERNDDD